MARDRVQRVTNTRSAIETFVFIMETEHSRADNDLATIWKDTTGMRARCANKNEGEGYNPKLNSGRLARYAFRRFPLAESR